jgi:hypothetical protein
MRDSSRDISKMLHEHGLIAEAGGGGDGGRRGGR